MGKSKPAKAPPPAPVGPSTKDDSAKVDNVIEEDPSVDVVFDEKGEAIDVLTFIDRDDRSGVSSKSAEATEEWSLADVEHLAGHHYVVTYDDIRINHVYTLALKRGEHAYTIFKDQSWPGIVYQRNPKKPLVPDGYASFVQHPVDLGEPADDRILNMDLAKRIGAIAVTEPSVS